MTSQPTRTSLQLACAAERGMECAHTADGHALHPMRRRLAAATSSKWADAIVVGVDADGWLHLVSVETAASVRVWHHGHPAGAPQVGEPVALHTTYGVLAIGSDWRSVVTEPRVAESIG